jgi:RHH-type transcriptional regulator, rel operon repressor / antitoxin RelB
LPKEIEDRLTALARKTGRTKSYSARQAILDHLEDLEDAQTAIESLKNDDGVRIPLAAIIRELDAEEACLRHRRSAAV